MSGFLRPEVEKKLRRYGEALVGLSLALIGVATLWRGFARFDLMTQALGFVVLLLGALLLYVGYRRAQFAQDVGGIGHVEIKEQQIIYLSALGGASIDLEAMTRLELRSTQHLGRSWVLKQAGGPSLMIPIDASGATGLFDVFQALPGLSAEMLVAALKTPASSRQIVWRGAPGFRALT